MDKKSQIQKITLIGFLANILLSIVKFIIGSASNSQAVVADALHSLSDTSSDLVILFGVKYWTAPPDEDHPYGHHRIESFITIVIGLILIGISFSIGYNAVTALIEGQKAHINAIAVIGPLLSILIKEILFKMTYQVGITVNSSSLKANAWHHRTDALSSIPVLIAVLATLIDARLAFLDQVGALIVSAFIFKIGLEILASSINELLDTGVSKEKIKIFKKAIYSIEGVKGVHRIRTRKMASYIYIDLHLEVDGRMSVTQGHDISEQVKTALLKNNPKIIDVMVHLEPEKKEPSLLKNQ